MTDSGPFDPIDDLTLDELRRRMRSLQSLLSRAPGTRAQGTDRERPAVVKYAHLSHAAATILQRQPERDLANRNKLAPVVAQNPHAVPDVSKRADAGRASRAKA